MDGIDPLKVEILFPFVSYVISKYKQSSREESLIWIEICNS